MSGAYAKATQLYAETDMRVEDICTTCQIGITTFYRHISPKFSKEFKSQRKRPNYSSSKVGDKNPMKGRYGQQHPNWKGECFIKSGYVLTLKPDWYTGKPGSKHVFLHQVEWCKAFGYTEVPRGFVLHHVDGNKLNNHPSNLMLVTPRQHRLIHAYERATTIRSRSSEVHREVE